MTIEISLPDEFLEFFKGSREKLTLINRLILAIDLYLEEKVSLSKAAELSDLDLENFILELSKRNIRRKTGYMSVEDVKKEMAEFGKFLK